MSSIEKPNPIPKTPSMGPRRDRRIVNDPKVRHVGFFPPAAPPDGSQSGPPDPISSSHPVSGGFPSFDTVPPVNIPPPHLLSSGHSHQLRHAPPIAESSNPVGSCIPSEFLSNTATAERFTSSEKLSTPLSVGVFDNLDLSTDGVNVELQKDQKKSSGSTLKEKTTKAERREMQEAQRAAESTVKGEGSETSSIVAAFGVNPANANLGKSVMYALPMKDSYSVAASKKIGGDRQPDKDRKKDVPRPRMQFDDATRVDKAKKRSVVKRTQARSIVELFRHLPQYEHGMQLPGLESKFFLDQIHPAIYNVGLRYLAGDISGGNARCIAMLQAFQDSIHDYSTPPEKSLIRDLTTKINGYVSFLIECRPLSISMGNAIRFLKKRIAQLPSKLSELEAKVNLISAIERFISENIIVADKVIVKHAVTKIRDGDVLLTFASSSAIEMLLLHAHELGKQFRVVIVDSRPKLEGQKLLRRLVGKGITCTYTHINALCYIMHEVTRVFLGASSVLSNGTVYSRVGTACVAMVAHQLRVPVLICCEAYKFHERVQLDSICSNELGDPDAISKISGREINSLDGWANSKNLQLLNLIYDATPSDYVSVIVSDHGMVSWRR
ncbi:hypothetical protein ACS0TY_028598 [Phlomoides rotata]